MFTDADFEEARRFRAAWRRRQAMKAIVTIGGFASAAAWMTHIVTCVQQEAWALLAIGAFLVPIGVIHGYAVWFGIL